MSLLFSSISELTSPSLTQDLQGKLYPVDGRSRTTSILSITSISSERFRTIPSNLINPSVNRSPLSAFPHSPAYITRDEAECCMPTTAMESNSPFNQLTGSQYFRKQHLLSPLLRRQLVLSSVQFSSVQLMPPYINTVCSSPSRLASASTHLISSQAPIPSTQTLRRTRIELQMDNCEYEKICMY